MRKLILITMIISFSSLSLFAASKSEIEKLERFECDVFEIGESIEINNPFSKRDSLRRLCHMKN